MKTQKKPEIQNIYPLTPMQEGMLYNSLVNRDSHAYFEQISFDVHSDIDVNLMEKSLNAIIGRHEILRAVFNHKKAERPIQIILKERSAKVYSEDITNLSENEREKYIANFKSKEKDKGFDLSKDLLIKLSIFKTNTQVSKLIFSFHHILMDGWCIGIVIKELFHIYGSLEKSQAPALEKSYSYGNYLNWLQNQDMKEAREYWKNYLEDSQQQTALPRTGSLAESSGYEQRDLTFKLCKELTNGLVSIARSNNVTINTVFQAIWGILLRQYNNSEDVVFGAVVSGRPSEVDGADKMVGLFINTIPVRVKFARNTGFNILVNELQAASLASEKYDYFPLAQIQADTELKQGLISHIMVFENYPLEENITGENEGLYGYKIDKVEVFEQTNYDFNIMVTPGKELSVKLNYNAQVYHSELVKNIEKHLTKIIQAVIENSGICINDIYILTDEEEKQILGDFNNTKLEYSSDMSIHQLFEERVRSMPDNTAVAWENGTMTYRELNEKANQLARLLRKRGVKRDSLVGVMTKRSPEMLIGMMGTLKAGGAYIPIDPGYPEDRIRYMLENSGTEFLLTQSTLNSAQLLKDNENTITPMNLDDSEIYNGDASNPENVNKATDLAYMIYTSGSTGQPKGVMIEHRSVNNFIAGMSEKINFADSSSVLCLTTISFDIFVLETLLPLTKGLKVTIANETEQRNAQALNDLILKNNVDIVQATPSRMKMMVDEHLPCLKNLKQILVGGEEFPEILRNRLKELTCGRIFNVYGPTETTVWSTLEDVTEKKELTIGRPIANTQIYILDKENKRLKPVGIPGELYIGGDGLARGYFKRNELTDEKFINNPFEPIGKSKIYSTGDLAKWTPDGNIEFLGREDHQVKVRGYRIELGEIETRLTEIAGINEALVVADNEQNGIKYLCAYIVCDQVPDIKEIREYLSEKLPDYMVPSYFIDIERVPLTPNGKVDRKSLPKPSKDIVTGTEYAAPQTELEKKLTGIWCEILGTEKAGVNDNFFSLGGHSIYMIQILARVANQLQTDISINEFIDNSSICKLSALIEKKNCAYIENNIYKHREPEPENIYEPFPLTEVQRAYLMGRDDGFEMGGISTHIYMEIETELNVETFNTAVNRMIKRHPMLRAVILTTGEQKILKEVPEYKIEISDLSEIDSIAQTAYIEKERNRMSHNIFKSDQWPLFEIKASKLNNKINYIFIGLDMLIADASSMRILTEEIQQCYKQPDIILPELKFSFRDYIMAHNEFITSEKYQEDKKYWLSKVEDFPNAPALPLKSDPAMVKKPHFKRMKANIDRTSWDKLKKRAYENKITPSALLCTAYAQVLGLWSNQRHLAVNLTVFNRYPFHEDINRIIGDFTSVLLLGIDLVPETAFWQKAGLVHKTLMEALEHRHYDGINFIRDIARYNNLGGKAAMPVVFTSMLMESKGLSGNDIYAQGRVKMAITQTSQVYIDHQATEENGELVLIWDYVEELFDEKLINTMFEQYIDSMNDLAEDINPQLHLNTAYTELIDKYNDTIEDIPHTTLNAMFREQVKRVPDCTAVIFKDQSISYRELDNRSNSVARFLGNKGIGKNDFVGVLAQRCIDTIINIIGIIKARAAYVPVDPEYPEERRSYILENSGCRLMLDPELYARENLEQYSSDYINLNIHPEDIAYTIYTSGSTGRPKGVVISHGAAANTIIDINRKFNVNKNDRVIGLSSMCFDLSVYDIFGALAAGAALVMIEDQRDALELIRTVEEKQITIWNSVPAIMDMMIESMDRDIPDASLRLVMVSGDWVPLGLPHKVKKHFKNAEVISLGGATEAAIWSIYYPVNEIKRSWRSIPYGMPLANQKFYVLNYEMELCPPGVAGELYIGGAGVAEGYMNDAEKTQAAFIKHPVLGRLYKTGDFGVLHPEDDLNETYIEFMGRKDHQVKIRGYRIELGEIENCLLKHDFVSGAVVVDKTDASGKKVLCGYYISEDDELTEEELKVFLSRHLPDYMIPAYFIELYEIPVTPNGKIDRKALPMPDFNTGDNYAAPANEAEKALCSIWEEVLEIERVGVNDNYFDLGGNSLNAPVILSKINKKFNISIPLREVFGLPTVKDIAQYIAGNTHDAHKIEDSNLVLLRKGADESRHLFLIHAGSGEVEGYMGFCNNLRDDFNYWAIRADRLNNYTPVNITIEELAEKYINLIKKIQAKGPYYIAGWCVGGTIAFEMVRQIEASGENVDLFTLFNSYAPELGFYGEINEFSIETERKWVEKYLGADAASSNLDLAALSDINTIWPSVIDFANKSGMEKHVLGAIKEGIPDNIAGIIPDFDNANLEHIIYYLNTIKSYSNARAKYIPSGNVDTAVHFIGANETEITNRETWKKYCNSEIDFEDVAGNHFTIFKEPYVTGLAEKFSRYFGKI